MARLGGIAAAVFSGLLFAPGVHAACQGPDLAVTEISVGSIESKRENTYDFEISCVVRNNGGADFVSAETAQGIHLFETKSSDSEPRRLKFRHFADLPVGEKLLLSRNILDFPASGIAGLKFVCRIEYDAALASDESKDNDDCNPINNAMELSSDALVELFAKIGK